MLILGSTDTQLKSVLTASFFTISFISSFHSVSSASWQSVEKGKFFLSVNYFVQDRNTGSATCFVIVKQGKL